MSGFAGFTIGCRVVRSDDDTVSVQEPFVIINLSEVRTFSAKGAVKLAKDSEHLTEMFKRHSQRVEEAKAKAKAENSTAGVDNSFEVFELTYTNGEQALFLFRHDYSLLSKTLPWRV